MQYFGFARINTYNIRGSLKHYARGHKNAIKLSHTHTSRSSYMRIDKGDMGTIYNSEPCRKDKLS